MKKVLLVMILLSLVNFGYAQLSKYGSTENDSTNCCLTFYSAHYPKNKKKLAFEMNKWRKKSECCKSYDSYYTRGIHYYKQLINWESDSALIIRYVDSLTRLHDKRIENIETGKPNTINTR